MVKRLDLGSMYISPHTDKQTLFSLEPRKMVPRSWQTLLLVTSTLLMVPSASQSIEERLLRLEAKNEVLEHKVQTLEQEVVQLKSVIQDQENKLQTKLRQHDSGTRKHPIDTGISSVVADNLESPKRILQSENEIVVNSTKNGKIGNLNEAKAKRPSKLPARIADKLKDTQGHEQIIIEDQPTTESLLTGRAARTSGMAEAPVAFFAVLPNTRGYGRAQTVVFGNEITDTGDAYHEHTGVFMAPYNGAYAFSVTLWGRKRFYESGYFSLQVNGQVKASLLTRTTVNGDLDCSSVMATLYLSARDEVWVASDNDNNELLGNNYSSFSGFLLQ